MPYHWHIHSKMPGIKLYFSLFNDNCVQRYEIWCPSSRIGIKLFRCLIISQIKSLNLNQSTEPLSKLVLLFNGQRLEDKYSVDDYKIEENDVVQVMFSSTLKEDKFNISENESDEKDTDPFENGPNVQLLEMDDYYRVGEHVDAFNPETSSWFPAQIIQIKQNQINANDIYYYVSFYKSSLGGYSAKRLSHIRPQPYRRIEKHQLEPGKLVLVFIDCQWHVGAIEMIKRSQQDRSTRIWLGLVTHGDQMPMVRHMIKFTAGHIFSLESNVKINERNDCLDEIIKSGSKVKRKYKLPIKIISLNNLFF